jgi:hypothetical protein
MVGTQGALANGWRPLMLIDVFAPREKALSYRPWELLSWAEYTESTDFCLESQRLGSAQSIPSQPFPPEYESGYNLVASVADVHKARLKSLNQLRTSAAPKLMSIAPPIRNPLVAPILYGG